jgi:hypothetical protein
LLTAQLHDAVVGLAGFDDAQKARIVEKLAKARFEIPILVKYETLFLLTGFLTVG